MRIFATVRTYNEAQHIEKFCNAFSFADKILVADGGSADNTVSLALNFPNVSVRPYHHKVECENGIWRNPDGPHIQFLIDWAIEEGADWIIHQDCDQRPNKTLKENIRAVLSETNKDFIMVTQIFLWGKDKYFPMMSGGEGNWQQGMWGWRANAGIKIIDKMPHFEFSFDGQTSIDIPQTGRCHYLLPPYCFMHFGWETPEKTDAHVQYYRQSGLIKNMAHPLQSGGPVKPLLDWMIE